MTMEPSQLLLTEELLSADGIVKMSVFLTYVSRFKQDIFLAMDAKSHALWDILKGVVWSWKEKMQTIEECYQLYSHNLSYHGLFCNMCSHRMISCWLGVLYSQSLLCQ